LGRDKIKKGGVVDDPVHRLEAIEKLKQFAESLGIERLGLIESPITGMDGNVEYLAHWKLKNV
jgi:23S rRNA (cytidine1920-2'-O)/16S rRNA (cytidine1409-2'-O)-methyltransferase